MHLKSVDYSKYIGIADMGLLRRLPTPSLADKEKDDGIVYTLKDYGDKVFETILRRHLSASMIIAANDYYGNNVINGKGRKHQMYSFQRKDFSR